MSQPTRARTTGAATRKPRKSNSAASAPAEQDRHAATTAEQPAESTPETRASAGIAGLAPETLVRTLRAVAAELERDPALARRVADAIATTPDAAPSSTAEATVRAGVPASDERDGERAPSDEPTLRSVNRGFRPRLVTGASPDLGAGIPDPFALAARLGVEGLRAALEELRLGSLRAIVREHNLDPKGALAQQNDAEKLRVAILKAAKKGRAS